ncbi:MAG: hypothetical protein Q9195_008982 [Heterodermia aff. obscurata]
MASFVTVVDSSARRVKIKTTPEKSLSEVLQEACSSWRYNASLYGLKNNNKTLDLSRTIRLSGLSSGAKLELIKLSKTPTAISVALQLPESEKAGVSNGRMTDKFASSTSLWQILRSFESANAGGLDSQKNFTGRGVPSMVSGNSGAGRLYYEEPVLRIMGREYSSLTDLQKSLGQLGFNGGSVLLHLNFRASEVPLEQAQEKIEAYFRSLEENDSDTHGVRSGAVDSEVSTLNVGQQILTEEKASKTTEIESSIESVSPAEHASGLTKDDNDLNSSATPNSDDNQGAVTDQAPAGHASALPELGPELSELQEDSNGQIPVTNGKKRKTSAVISREGSPFSEPFIDGPAEPTSSQDVEDKVAAPLVVSSDEPSVTGPDQRPISIFSPPSSTIPQAARRPHNEQDYEPTIAQQQRYQAHLGKISQQQRLLSDSEIDAQAKAQVEKLASINEVEIKVRFPDQSSVSAKFDNTDTSATLYDHVKGLMEHGSEPFSLRFTTPKGAQLVPKDSTVKLISDLGMVGRVLVTVIWDEGANMNARAGPILKAKFRENAQNLEVKEVEGTVEDRPNLGWGRLGEGRSQGDGKSNSAKKLLSKLRKK